MSLPKRTEENKCILDRIARMPIAIYTYGFCYYGHEEPYRTVEVPNDLQEFAKPLAWEQNDDKILNSMILVDVKPNPERVALMKQVGWLKEK